MIYKYTYLTDICHEDFLSHRPTLHWIIFGLEQEESISPFTRVTIYEAHSTKTQFYAWISSEHAKGKFVDKNNTGYRPRGAQKEICLLPLSFENSWCQLDAVVCFSPRSDGVNRGGETPRVVRISNLTLRIHTDTRVHTLMLKSSVHGQWERRS